MLWMLVPPGRRAWWDLHRRKSLRTKRWAGFTANSISADTSPHTDSDMLIENGRLTGTPPGSLPGDTPAHSRNEGPGHWPQRTHFKLPAPFSPRGNHFPQVIHTEVIELCPRNPRPAQVQEQSVALPPRPNPEPLPGPSSTCPGLCHRVSLPGSKLAKCPIGSQTRPQPALETRRKTGPSWSR